MVVRSKKWYSARSAKEKKLTVATLYKTFYEMFPEEKKKGKNPIFNNPEYLKEKEKCDLHFLDFIFSYT